MNIFSKLEQLTKVTESESVLLGYICEHPENIVNMGVNEVCQKIFVSKPTVYRLCKKIGVKGYSDLKVIIAMQLKNNKKELADYNYPFKQRQTQNQILDGMCDLYHQTIEDTKDILDSESFRLVIQELLHANKIKLFPSVGNVFMAESFQQNMLEIGVLVDVVNGGYNQHWSACASCLGEVAIVISYLGKTREIEDVVKALKKNKAKIILISATYEERLSKYVDHHLYMCSFEHHQEKIASFSSRVSLQYLLDCIYSCYFNRNYEKNIAYKIINYID